MFNQPMQVELQAHNGCAGRERAAAPFDGRILECHDCGIADQSVVPAQAFIHFDGRKFTYAYTVAFPSNGFYVFRENVR